MNLAIITAHAGANSLSECLLSWSNGYSGIPVTVMDGRFGLLEAFQWGFLDSSAEILAYFHDDLKINLPQEDRHPNWAYVALREFEDPKVGLVGFGGALAHGSSDLYKTTYQLQQLARFDFLSNLDDAEVHGGRFTGACDVAVLDGFAMIVRREVLERAGGWPVGKIQFHCYDYWLSCITRRLGYRIRMVGVPCNHLGGRTSVGQKMDDGLNHAPAHEYIYKEFKDVLPYRVPGV